MNRVQEHTRKNQRTGRLCRLSEKRLNVSAKVLSHFLHRSVLFEGKGKLIFYVRHWLGIENGLTLCWGKENVWRRGRDLNPRYPMGKLDFESLPYPSLQTTTCYTVQEKRLSPTLLLVSFCFELLILLSQF